jgi:hypothetical protein
MLSDVKEDGVLEETSQRVMQGGAPIIATRTSHQLHVLTQHSSLNQSSITFRYGSGIHINGLNRASQIPMEDVARHKPCRRLPGGTH